MEQYIMYLRKSQMDRDFEEMSVEETLNRHRKLLTEYAEQHKLYIAITLEEVVSGESLSSRPQMMKCLELVATGEYAGVLCMDTERLSRGNSMDSGYIMQVFQAYNCRIITPAKTYDLSNESDEQFADMKFMFARYELKTITKRMVRGREISASEGKFLGSLAPYGYEKYKLKGEKGFSLKIVPEQATVVRLIFDLYTEKGMGYGKISQELERLGIQPSPPITSWGTAVIVKLLQNPVYAGKIRYKYKLSKKVLENGKMVKKRFYNSKEYELHDGLHEAIISEEQWQKSLEVRKENLPTKFSLELTNPLARLVKCEACGKTLIRHMTTQNPVRYRLSCRTKGCPCRSIYLHTLENAVIDELRSWLKDYTISIKNCEIEADLGLADTLKQTQKQLAELEAQQDKICDFLEKGVYSLEMFTKRNKTLQDDIKKLKEAEKNISSELSKQVEKKKNSIEIIPKVQHLLESYDDMTPQEKNDLLKEILYKIDYYAEPNSKDFRFKLYTKI